MSITGKHFSFSSESSAVTADPFKLTHRMQAGQGAEEKALSLFQPDILLPSQYLATTRRKIPSQPEKKLMLAILEDAVVSFQKFLFAQNGRGKNLFRDAEQWIFQENGAWVFSFEGICETLELSPSYLRKGLMEWVKKELANERKAKIYSLRPEDKSKKRETHESGAKKQKYLKAAGC